MREFAWLCINACTAQLLRGPHTRGDDSKAWSGFVVSEELHNPEIAALPRHVRRCLVPPVANLLVCEVGVVVVSAPSVCVGETHSLGAQGKHQEARANALNSNQRTYLNVGFEPKKTQHHGFCTARDGHVQRLRAP